jgi:16S rRNA (guanine527-N7)-methyltransferase
VRDNVSHETSVQANADIGPSLASLGERYSLSGDQLAKFALLLGILASDEHAPTSVREPERALDVHVADSLVALELEGLGGAGEIVDIGAGAGFPGLPLAVALPAASFKLLDSQARKCAFVERVVTELSVVNAEVVCARVEEWPEGMSGHDLVLARAVAPQPIVLEYAAPLLRLGGRLIDWRGKRDREEERLAIDTADLLGLTLDSVGRVAPFAGVRDHHLHVYSKVRETPDRFPRRVGMARKKPLV